MWEKIKYLLSILLFTTLTICAQEKDYTSTPKPQSLIGHSSYHVDTLAIKPLKIGEKVPDIFLGELLNVPGKQLGKISDYKNRLLILDFWSVWCSVCIAQFPKIQKLQQKFGEKIALLPVGFDGKIEGSIKKFVKDRKGTASEMQIPTFVQATTNTILEKYFPFSSLPHEVWISPDGILLGITDEKVLTEKNIQDVLNGGSIQGLTKVKLKNLTHKDDFLFKRQPNSSKYQIYGSMYTGYIDSLTCGWPFGYQADSSYWRFFDINGTVFDYYIRAYKWKFKEIKKNKLLIEAPNFRLLDWNSLPKNADNTTFTEFMKQNTFSYEAIFPNTVPLDSAREMVIKNLDQIFNVTSLVANREVNCLALVETKKDGKFISTSSIDSTFNDDKNTNKVMAMIKGKKIEEVATFLSSLLLNNSIIEVRTTHTGRINLKIPIKKMRVEELNEVLYEYDLKLIPATKIEKVLTLR